MVRARSKSKGPSSPSTPRRSNRVVTLRRSTRKRKQAPPKELKVAKQQLASSKKKTASLGRKAKVKYSDTESSEEEDNVEEEVVVEELVAVKETNAKASLLVSDMEEEKTSIVETKKQSQKQSGKAAAKAELKASGKTKLVLRLMYTVYFIASMITIFAPEKVDFALAENGPQMDLLHKTMLRFMGILILQMTFLLIAAVQGNHSDQKKTLQYMMFFPFMVCAAYLKNLELFDKDVVKVEVAVQAIFLLLGIWACYSA